MQLLILPGGQVRTVYSEELDLARIGPLTIRRGSHVEPDDVGQWFADLAPVDGPRLGPFSRRSDALQAESDWLNEHWLVPPSK